MSEESQVFRTTGYEDCDIQLDCEPRRGAKHNPCGKGLVFLFHREQWLLTCVVS